MQRPHHDSVHLVIGDVTDLAEVDRVDDLVESVLLVSIKVLSLTAMTGVVEKEGVVRTGILNQPMHSSKDVLLGGLAHGVLLIIGEDDHILSLIAKVLNEIPGHVSDIIDAAAELSALPEVINADQQRFPSASALRVLECIPLRGAIAEVLWRLWRRRGSLMVPMDVRIGVHRGHARSPILGLGLGVCLR
jgi:hypothetical protein